MKKVLLLLLSCWFVSCKEQTNEVVDQISISVHNLPRLNEGGAHYQLWVRYYLFNKAAGGDSPLHQGEYLSMGEFNVGDDGNLQGLDGGTSSFALPAGENTQLLSDVFIAVQTAQEGLAKISHEQPGAVLIGAYFSGDAATAFADLDTKFTGGLKSDFAAVTGKCTIVAPTSPQDSNAGAWFVEPGSSPSAGLKNLPGLPSGWKYEGWVIRQQANVPVAYYSMGKFARADSADSDGGGPNSGTGTPYNFPGQDFVTGAFHPNLTEAGYSFMVTIEPVPDNSPAPFFLTVLRTSTPLAAGSRTLILSNVMSASSPGAKVAIRR